MYRRRCFEEYVGVVLLSRGLLEPGGYHSQARAYALEKRKKQKVDSGTVWSVSLKTASSLGGSRHILKTRLFF